MTVEVLMAGPAPAPSAEATVAIVRAMIDKALEKRYRGGVIGVRARPVWSGPETFTHRDRPARVVVCRSALAVREALRERSAGRWLVVITDRDDADLGAGILAHLVFQRLRTPDPWDAVCQAFHASAVDAALVGLEGSRLVAGGLLDAGPAGAWPPAPGGVLTRDHALSAVAHRYLLSASPGETGAGAGSAVDGVVAGPGDVAGPDEIDATSVWTWTTRTDAARRIAELRGIAGDPLTAATLAWLAAWTGAPEKAVLRLLENGRVSDAVPLGLLLGLLAEVSAPSGPSSPGPRPSTAPGPVPSGSDGDRDSGIRRIARDALVRLEVPLGGVPPGTPIGGAWATDARTVTVAMLHTPVLRSQAVDLLDRADRLLAQIRGEPLAAGSDLLPSGLTARLERLARMLSDAVVYRPADDPDRPLVAAHGMDAVEKAWAAVDAHALAGDDERVAAFRGGVRLARSLAEPAAATAGFAELLIRHRDHDGWVDAAFNAAARGVGETSLGNALQAVLVAARARRDSHDRAFAAALVQHTADDSRLPEPDPLHIEDVLARHVLPLARSAPVLLVVLDGMSLATAIEVVADVTGQPRRWQEAVPAETGRRVVAVTALPTDTHGSRTSLLCGELRTGGQQTERDGLKDLARAHRLGDSASLYHRGLLEETRLGMAVSDDVAAAIADVDSRRLVSCVLNTIDDALDRADPGGTAWTVDAVRHLRPLLRQAWQAGRCVVLTSDHGHVIDRRDGIARSPEHVINARARAASSALRGGAADDEVYIAGRRVLVADGRAVLAVNERLRYVSRRAGYHGGAAPAEVVVPLITLVPGDVVPTVSDGPRLRLAPDQEPSWWKDPDLRPASAGREAVASGPRSAMPEGPVPTAPPVPAPSSTPAAMLPLFDGEDEGEGERLVDRVLASAVFRSQERMTRGRGAPERVGLRALLTTLIDAPGNRLTQQQTAAALGDHPLSVRRAVMSAIRLLNVEGYAVLSLDADGTTTVLDLGLLREQFGV
ncbi:BREX-2 system phosphatase PglZ [Frankia sp. Cas3]|uniref:BREX-2 system phosphatase PglZ n=1 Tax=Frankia sp. Cas3 TaxID=3073926 RepID=UPI002AD489AC|nr:BREX-2 system phosphatase PglZ [Frankia sp. Cas3]